MRVELSPHRVEVTVGESVVLSCKATHDTSLDVTFQWFFNQRPITFQQDGGHFEYIQTVRAKVRLLIGFHLINDLTTGPTPQDEGCRIGLENKYSVTFKFDLSFISDALFFAIAIYTRGSVPASRALNSLLCIYSTQI